MHAKQLALRTGIAMGLLLAAPIARAQDNANPPAAGDVVAPVEVDETYAGVLAAIKSGAAAADISGSSGADVTVIQLSALQGDAEHDGAEVDAAVADNQAAVGELRTAITANAALVAKLQEVGATPEEVVAVAKGDDGTLRVYVDDRKK